MRKVREILATLDESVRLSEEIDVVMRLDSFLLSNVDHYSFRSPTHFSIIN